MKKKAVACILALGMLATLLTGCGGSAEPDAGSAAETAEDAETEGVEAEASSEGEEPYEVKIELMTMGGELADIPMVEEAINEITVPAINCKVSILHVAVSEHANKMSMMIAGGEKLDLCMAGITTRVTGMANDGMLLELDELLAEYGSDLQTMFGEELDAGKVDGKLYAVPANNSTGKAGGFTYNKEMADAAGVTIPERCTVDEFVELYRQVQESNPDVYLTTQGIGNYCGAFNHYIIDNMGDSTTFSYGVIVEPQENTQIENWFLTEQAKEYYKKVRSWYEEGIIPSDSMTSGLEGQNVFAAKQIFALAGNYAPAELPIQASNYDFEIGMTQITDAYRATDVLQERMWGIPVTCENPEKTMQFLNLLYTNTDVANLLHYGIEGRNYEVVEEGVINKLDAENPGYNCVFSMFGDQSAIYYKTPAKTGIQEEVRAFSESAQNAKTTGYVFNPESISAKAAAVSNVVQQYAPSLECGLIADVDAALEQIVNEMNAAGMEEVLAENQKQLDAWLAAK